MRKVLYPAQKEKEQLLKEMTALSKALKCHGPMGELSLTGKEEQEIALSVIAAIGIMSHDAELVRNALALGANPEQEIKGRSLTLTQLAKAFKDKKILKIIDEFTPPSLDKTRALKEERPALAKKRPRKS